MSNLEDSPTTGLPVHLEESFLLSLAKLPNEEDRLWVAREASKIRKIHEQGGDYSELRTGISDDLGSLLNNVEARHGSLDDYLPDIKRSIDQFEKKQVLGIFVIGLIIGDANQTMEDALSVLRGYA